jgi:hypothetical protein
MAVRYCEEFFDRLLEGQSKALTAYYRAAPARAMRP